MATDYSYTISTDFKTATQINIEQLQREINNDVTISVDSIGISVHGDDVTIHFPSALSGPQKTGLDSLVNTYVYQSPDDVFIITVTDQKQTGVNGGTFTSGSWQTRTLNTVSDTQTWLTLSSNQITLQEGDYLITISAPACSVNSHQMRLRNITDSKNVAVGTGERSPIGTQTKSTALVRLSITSQKTFEVQHRCLNTRETIGYGIAIGLGEPEVYTSVTIENVF